MSTRAFDEMDWEIRGAALWRIEPMERIMIRKLLWGELPTASKLARNGYRRDGKCAMCKDVDSKKHFLECEGLNTTEEMRIKVGVMKGKLASLNTNPYLTKWIMESLNGKSPRLNK